MYIRNPIGIANSAAKGVNDSIIKTNPTLHAPVPIKGVPPLIPDVNSQPRMFEVKGIETAPTSKAKHKGKLINDMATPRNRSTPRSLNTSRIFDRELLKLLNCLNERIKFLGIRKIEIKEKIKIAEKSALYADLKFSTCSETNTVFCNIRRRQRYTDNLLSLMR